MRCCWYDYMEEKEFRELVIENGKRLSENINNQNRISAIENYLFKHTLRYRILDIFLIINAIDLVLKSIIGIGIVGCGTCIYRYIIGLF